MRFFVIMVRYSNIKGLERAKGNVISQVSRDSKYIIIDAESVYGSVDTIKKYGYHMAVGDGEEQWHLSCHEQESGAIAW